MIILEKAEQQPGTKCYGPIKPRGVLWRIQKRTFLSLLLRGFTRSSTSPRVEETRDIHEGAQGKLDMTEVSHIFLGSYAACAMTSAVSAYV
mmetsp:Transcript_10460/g.24761  ORF Transcript_10460/g.24761 Transcript_10460/m.24761 type:complete len:91 (-) Transcript_10460:172-444(-)